MKEIRSDLVALLPESFVSRIPEGDAFAAWVAAGPDELVTVLATLGPQSLEAAARALAKLGDPAVEVLTRAASTVTGKPSQKALRRALHALRSRGVAVAEVRTPESARVPGIREEPGQGFAGPIDPEGLRVLMLLVPQPPSPVTGPIIFVPEADVIPLDLPVESAVKLVMSGGVVGAPLNPAKTGS